MTEELLPRVGRLPAALLVSMGLGPPVPSPQALGSCGGSPSRSCIRAGITFFSLAFWMGWRVGYVLPAHTAVVEPPEAMEPLWRSLSETSGVSAL